MNLEKLNEIRAELPPHVTLVAVSKTRTKAEVDEAYAAGCTVFGENKVQEIAAKYDERYHWHMIGHLQRNKVKQVLPLVDMIESLDNLPLAKEIEKQAAKIDKVIPVLVEINISMEPNKTGIPAGDCLLFVKTCREMRLPAACQLADPFQYFFQHFRTRFPPGETGRSSARRTASGMRYVASRSAKNARTLPGSTSP